MKRLSAVVMILASLLTGCSALLSQTPRTGMVLVPRPPREVYPHALHAFAQMGGLILTARPDVGVISGTVHNAVTLTVLLSPIPGGTRVEASGTVLPHKLVVGTFTEVDDYLALLR